MSDTEPTELLSTRLILRPLTVEQSRAVVSNHRQDQWWAPDYPTEGDSQVASRVLMALDEHPTQWCAYQVVERTTGMVVGGIGFKGLPLNGVVEIGYGLGASAQGRGLATEAVATLVEAARRWGDVVALEADTDPGNLASQRVLLRAGFEHVGRSGDSELFRRTLS